MDQKEIDNLSTLALAHVGDGVYELLVRTRLARQGISRVNDLHRATVALVKAPAQAEFAERILPALTEEELACYRRGRNAHVHAVPKSATPAQYARATGLEALFGALFLSGQLERANERFVLGMEGYHGL